MAQRGREEWVAAVFHHKGLNNGVRVLLLYLAHNMRPDLTVCVPRTEIAEALNLYPSRVTERIKAAHDAGLLATIVHGRERTTAVYKAMFPNREVQRGGQLGGTELRTSQDGLGGTDGGSTLSETSPSEAREPTAGDSSSVSRASRANEKSEKQQGGPVVAGRETCRSAVAGRGTSETRRELLTAITIAARDGLDSDAGEELLDLLEAHYGEELAGQVANYWSVPLKATSRYQAGVWLNKLEATARRDGWLKAGTSKEPEPSF